MDQESFGCDLDLPPGFETKNVTVNLPSVSSSKDCTAKLSTEGVCFLCCCFFLSFCSACVSFLTDRPMTLQLQVEQESFDCDLDSPPGFETEKVTVELPSVSSSFNDEKGLSKFSHAMDSEANDRMQLILDCVLEELHLSAKMSLEEYFTSLLHEEVTGKVHSLEDGMITKVNV